jgi:hypothetical protein
MANDGDTVTDTLTGTRYAICTRTEQYTYTVLYMYNETLNTMSSLIRWAESHFYWLQLQYYSITVLQSFTINARNQCRANTGTGDSGTVYNAIYIGKFRYRHTFRAGVLQFCQTRIWSALLSQSRKNIYRTVASQYCTVA